MWTETLPRISLVVPKFKILWVKTFLPPIQHSIFIFVYLQFFSLPVHYKLNICSNTKFTPYGNFVHNSLSVNRIMLASHSPFILHFTAVSVSPDYTSFSLLYGVQLSSSYKSNTRSENLIRADTEPVRPAYSIYELGLCRTRKCKAAEINWIYEEFIRICLPASESSGQPLYGLHLNLHHRRLEISIALHTQLFMFPPKCSISSAALSTSRFSLAAKVGDAVMV
jgi:hypothetical protein